MPSFARKIQKISSKASKIPALKGKKRQKYSALNYLMPDVKVAQNVQKLTYKKSKINTAKSLVKWVFFAVLLIL
jgi:hypothetical protein